MRICPYCHTQWAPSGKGWRRYCSDACRAGAKKERDRLKQREKRFKGERPILRKEERQPENNLTENVMNAREAGMSYGMYMSLKRSGAI